MYEAFFGLREAPFSLNPDPRFLWLSDTHQEALAALSYGIATRAGFILITGGVGSGKTTLLRAALARVPSGFETGLIANTAGLSDLDLLKLVATEFRAEGRLRGKADCLVGLKAALLERQRTGVKPVLVIDEAQNLSVNALEQVRLLSNFETDREKLVQIILAGQPELRRKLALPRLEPLSQRIVIDHHLEPLRPFEVRLYLEHRLRVAGGRFEQVFDPGCETTFFGFSVGCPRLVSALADRALLAAYAQGVRPVPRALVEAKAKELDSARTDELWEADVWEC